MAAIPSARSRARGSALFNIGARNNSRAQPSADWFFIAVVGVLVVLGLVMAYTTTFFWSATSEGSPVVIFGKQLLYVAIGIVGFVLLSRIDYGFWRRLALPAMGVAILSLLGVLFWGDTILGAKRTLFNGSIQPSEPIKIIILLYGAAWLASRREQVTSITNGLIPFAVIVGAATAFIALQPDLSTSIVILLAASAMFFLAGASVVQIALVGGMSVATFALLVNKMPHAMERLTQFLDSVGNPQNTQYHIQQSLLAIGDGGLFGSGIGAGHQKFGLLPTPHTDSVFAVLAEEMGLLGVIVTLGLFALLAYRSLRIAQKADTVFGAFWAIGLITWIMIQALLNLLAMTGMLPLPGVPVPFLSVGGSSLVSVLAACGILVSISRGTKYREDEAQGNDYGDDTYSRQARYGQSGYRAGSSVRRRNSGSRATRPHRVESPDEDGIGASDIIGRDIKFTARLGKGPAPQRHTGSVRWRAGWNGTGSRLP
jgi:cell division protein FtsW